MISEQALERKKRRQELVANSGSHRKLRQEKQSRPWRVYFTEQGEIITFTQEENIDVKEDWLTYDFKQEQLEVLIGKNVRKYMVVKDRYVDNLYSIEIKKESFYEIDANLEYLIELVPTHDDSDYSLLCTISEDHFNLSLHPSVVEQYMYINPNDATVENKKILNFFITLPKDPHVLLQEIKVPLVDLLTQKEYSVKLDSNGLKSSVYTKKLFQSYKMVIKV